MEEREEKGKRRPPRFPIKGKEPLKTIVRIIFDERMLLHEDPHDVKNPNHPHPENPARILRIMNKLKSDDTYDRCLTVLPQLADDNDILLVHDQQLVELIKKLKTSSPSYRSRKAKDFNDVYFNKDSTLAAYVAAGCVIKLAKEVVLRSGFGVAVVRPPGHHAEHWKSMGFCIFNNIAIAARVLLREAELGIKKILIVDWDVHHGNGTQQQFWRDNNVLYFSVHRYDPKVFFPQSTYGSHDQTGEGPGKGYTINVPWKGCGYGDPDYDAVWDHILLPVARAFEPDIVLISAGFDSAENDPIGKCNLTPYGYSVMTSKLMEVSNGNVVLVLEGGYNLQATSDSFYACVRTLLGDRLKKSVVSLPYKTTWTIIQRVRRTLGTIWPILTSSIPPDILACHNGLEAPTEEQKEAADRGKIAKRQRKRTLFFKVGKKVSVKKRSPAYGIYLVKILKQISAKKRVNFSLSHQAMNIMNHFIIDMLHKIAQQASELARKNRSTTINSRDVQFAVRLVLPGGLGIGAMTKALEALKNFAA